jgi:hypothetical protein
MRQTAFKQQVVLEVVMNYREHHVEDRFFGGELEPLPMLSMKIDIAMEEPLEQARRGRILSVQRGRDSIDRHGRFGVVVTVAGD